ncbi:MAG TPA: alpha/beta hydrolase [Micromonosporaceae bacterium]
MANDSRGVLGRPAPPPDITVSYGDHPDQVIDVRLPPPGGEIRPIVIFVHGGFWRATWDRAHVGPLAADLAARGWPVATVEYRRTGEDGGGWPGTLDDVAAGIAAACDLGSAVGLGESTGTILAGHSAGGHLALWYAATHDARGPCGPGALLGVLALAPIADLAEAYRLNLDEGAVAALLGGGPEQWPDRYASADPIALDPPAGPVTLLHGTADAQVPIAQSRAYAARSDVRAELVELPGVGHFELIDPDSSAWPTVLDALRAG